MSALTGSLQGGARRRPGRRGGGPRTSDAQAGRAGAPAVTQLPSLTGLRWLAALAVFGFHVHVVRYFGTGTDAHVVRLVVGSGSTGVSFFFILSGFVLMWAFTPTASPARFWWRRFCRVYPLHAVTALVALAMVLWSSGDLPGTWTTVANLALVRRRRRTGSAGRRGRL